MFKKKGQSIIEFTFAMIATLLLVFGLVRIFRWVGMDLAERRYEHDANFNKVNIRPEDQLSPNFYKPRKLDAIFRGMKFH